MLLLEQVPVCSSLVTHPPPALQNFTTVSKFLAIQIKLSFTETLPSTPDTSEKSLCSSTGSCSWNTNFRPMETQDISLSRTQGSATCLRNLSLCMVFSRVTHHRNGTLCYKSIRQYCGSSETQEKFREPGNSQNMIPVQWLKGNICSALKQLEERKTFLAISPFSKEVRSLWISWNRKNKHKFLKNSKGIFLHLQLSSQTKQHEGS